MDLRERIASLMGQVRPELAEFLPIRSVADPRQFPPEECVEEPLALIHAPNESVDPAEIAAMALTEALFLQRYAAARR